MFLKKSFKTVKGKKYNHYAIVKSYREEGKVKHRILFPVGPLSDELTGRLHWFWKLWNVVPWVEAKHLKGIQKKPKVGC